jgi:hypothetical protein
MFGSMDFSNVQSIRNYEAADKYFNTTPAAPRSQKWNDDQRPLRDRRATYLRIEQRRDMYALCLYRHDLVRYYRPIDDMRKVEILNPTGHRANYEFLRNAGWGYGREIDSDIGTVKLVTLPSNEDKGLTASLVFRNGLLQTGESWQLQFYRRVATADQKEVRAKARERLEPYITLLEAALNGENIDNASGLYERKNDPHYRDRSRLDVAVVHMDFFVARDLAYFLRGDVDELGQNTYAVMLHAAKKLYARAADEPEFIKPVTRKTLMEFFISRTNRIIDKHPYKKKPLPMWPTGKLPRSRYFNTRAETEVANNS